MTGSPGDRASPDGQRLVVRDVTPEDTPAVVGLVAEHSAYERCPPPPADLVEVLPRLVRTGVIRCFVLQLIPSGEIVGYATATEDHATFTGRPFGYLDCLYVREAERGRGGGQVLFDRVRDWSAHRGHAELQWQTPYWNHRAQAFYRRQGATGRAKERFVLEHVGRAAGPAGVADD